MRVGPGTPFRGGRGPAETLGTTPALLVGWCLCGLALALPFPLPAQVADTVVIETTAGDITAEIHTDRAPITANNFLRYVDAGMTFYRSVRMDNQPNDSVRIEVIQAGSDRARRDRLRPSIPLERTTDTGLRHVDGTLSMARGGPDTATSSFFVCIGDQPSLDFGGLRNPDRQGFAAFGRVLDGMDVVRRIQMGAVDAQQLVAPIDILSIRRLGSR